MRAAHREGVGTIAAQHLILRADAGTTIGTGHVMRCLALAAAWQREGGQASLVGTCDSAPLRARVQAANVTLRAQATCDGSARDSAATLEYARAQQGSVVVLDGYQFDGAYQRAVKDAGFPLLVLDDFVQADYYWADLVLNQNLSADEFNYPREPYTRLLLGTDYVLLRPEFSRYLDWERRIPPQAQRILVTLGGSDADNVTRRVVEALRGVPGDWEAVVVVGAANPHIESLRRAAALSGGRIRLERDVPDMAEWMAWADLAVAAGGTTCWELAFMGLPSAMMVLAENQRRSAAQVQRHGIAVTLGTPGEVSEARLAAELGALMHDAGARQAMSRKGRQLVDGLGGARVAAALKELGKNHGVHR